MPQPPGNEKKNLYTPNEISKEAKSTVTIIENII